MLKSHKKVTVFLVLFCIAIVLSLEFEVWSLFSVHEISVIAKPFSL